MTETIWHLPTSGKPLSRPLEMELRPLRASRGRASTRGAVEIAPLRQSDLARDRALMMLESCRRKARAGGRRRSLAPESRWSRFDTGPGGQVPFRYPVKHISEGPATLKDPAPASGPFRGSDPRRGRERAGTGRAGLGAPPR